jgi:hypothetical protein
MNRAITNKLHFLLPITKPPFHSKNVYGYPNAAKVEDVPVIQFNRFAT